MTCEKKSASLPLYLSKVQQICEPLSQFPAYRDNFLKSKRWTNFMQLLWTDDQMSSIPVRPSLCALLLQNLDATFLDGTPMKIQYVFDPTRRNRDYVFVKVDCLSPLFGGNMPSTIDGFASITDLCFFVKRNLNLDKCQNFQHASCPCHQMRKGQELPDFVVKTSVNICVHQHFHHFCWKHVVSWLYNYLILMILLQESKQHFDEEIAYLYSMFPTDIAYFQSGKRTTPEFLFKTALAIHVAIYESDDEEYRS